jgi:hypothetical protein
MYRNSLNPWLPQPKGLSADGSRRYHHIEGGDLHDDNASDDNRPRFSIPRKPVLRTSVTGTYTEDFEMQKQKVNPPKDKFHHSLLSESSFLGILRVWWLEILCCFLVIGASLAIVATIYPYRDRPLPQWPYNLSINSLVSIYVVVLKAAMLLVLAEGKASKPIGRCIAPKLTCFQALDI